MITLTVHLSPAVEEEGTGPPMAAPIAVAPSCWLLASILIPMPEPEKGGSKTCLPVEISLTVSKAVRSIPGGRVSTEGPNSIQVTTRGQRLISQTPTLLFLSSELSFQLVAGG